MTGRVGKPTGLSQAEPQEGLGPSGFDPSRVANDQCPVCPGELDTGWECNSCGFDAILIARTLGETQQ